MPGNRSPQPGDVVLIRDARWRVVSRATHGSVVLLGVAAAGHEGRGRQEFFLLPFEACTPLPHDVPPRRVRRTEWRRVVRRHLADATASWQSLRTAAGADVTTLPFQLEPVMALVRRRACRFLIADAVGLGKTIQASLMVAEILARTADARVLIVVPAGLREQWVDELSDRFSLSAVLLDGASIPSAANAAGAGRNPWAALPLVVASIDYLKRPEVIRGLEGLVWDLLVLDEAHTLAGRSDRAATAAALAARARAVVMLSATPHSGDEAAFDRLRRLGDMDGKFPLCVFRRPRAVLGPAIRRRVRLWRITPSVAERAMHEALASYTASSSQEGNGPGARLVMSVLQRRAASSARSLVTSLERRLALLEAAPRTEPVDVWLPFGDLVEGDDAPEHELAIPALADHGAEVRHLIRVLALARGACASESKLRFLARLLARIDDTAIVFTRYRDTLATVAAVVNGGHAMLHGGLSSSERRSNTREFTHGDARVLLATDAASEGLNLQRRCRLVIHLEMPWTPAVLEQRIGRVDRLGQARNVHSIHLIAEGTSESDVAQRVQGRARRAEQALTVETGVGKDGRNDEARGSALGQLMAATPTAPAPDKAALEECARIGVSRSLAQRAARAAPYRAVITTPRRGASTPAVWAVRLPFVDDDGDVVWEALVALAGAQRGQATSPELLALTPEGARALRLYAQHSLAHLRESLGPAIDVMLARDQAIVGHLSRHRARLSAALLQRGLFGHRDERLASSQDLILREALEKMAAGIARLVRRRTVDAIEPAGLFGLGIPTR